MRRCGNCLHTQPEGDKLVYCLGCPPVVWNVETEGAQRTIHSQQPLLATEQRACGQHRYRWALFAWWWRLTGG